MATGDEPNSTPKRAAVWAAPAVGGLAMFASFEPLGWAPLAWLALVPLCLLARLDRDDRVLWPAYVGGLAWAVPQTQWMRLADPLMVAAWLALAAYMATYFPAFVALTRRLAVRVPLPVAAAVVWTGLELIRCRLMTGFPWYLLGHSQHDWTTLVQTADLAGVPPLSGLMAAFAATLAATISSGLLARVGLVPAVDHRASTRVVVVYGAVLIAALGYGRLRLTQADFQPGPRVAVAQGNFTSSMKHDGSKAGEMFAAHRTLTRLATPHQPDVIVWPETMVPYSLATADAAIDEATLAKIAPVDPSYWRDTTLASDLGDLGLRSGADLIFGIGRLVAGPAGLRNYNAAVRFTRDGVMEGVYDKVHRVPFGEYLPLSDWLTFLKAFSFVGGGLDAGEAVAAFEHAEAVLVPLICFEDTVPELAAEAVAAAPEGGRRAVLVNLTNDGWFHGSSELDQHLITASFRCIETRSPMVRAVNTGISAVIDGNGVVRDPDVMLDADAALDGGEPTPTTMRDDRGEYRRQFSAVLVDDVPLDPRGSLYLVTGDLPSWLCVAGCGWVAVLLLRDRRRTAKAAE